MQFVLIGLDGSDPEAPARRAAVREQHLERVKDAKASGELLYAVAMWDEGRERLKGSIMVFEMVSKEALDAWLAEEPYVTGKVWKSIQVEPASVPPIFLESAN
jgi:uncharacterized protein YciI